jgi:hypothetical protein
MKQVYKILNPLTLLFLISFFFTPSIAICGLNFFEATTFDATANLRYVGIFPNNAGGNNLAQMEFKFGLTKKIGDEMTFGGELSSGNADDPTETFDTFGNGFNREMIQINRYFFSYLLPDAEFIRFSAGKFVNPFKTSPLIWDKDLNPEGAYLGLVLKDPFGEAFINTAIFPFWSIQAALDSHIGVYQIGYNKSYLEELNFTLAFGYYDYVKPGTMSTLAVANGNSTNGDDLIYNYHIIDALFNFESIFFYPMSLILNYAINASRGNNNMGYLGQFNVGTMRRAHTMLIGYRFIYIEPDATLAAFNDSDTNHTDSKGHMLIIGYKPSEETHIKIQGFYLMPVTNPAEKETKFYITCGASI